MASRKKVFATTTAPAKSDKRWYAPEHVQQGAPLLHNIVGHGPRLRVLTGGKACQVGISPPPLNGTAHAWHHPMRARGHQIKFGAPGGGGLMPKLRIR